MRQLLFIRMNTAIFAECSGRCQNFDRVKLKKDFEMRKDCVGNLLVRVRYCLKIVEKALTLSAVRGMIKVEQLRRMAIMRGTESAMNFRKT
jgi:hypothetical protein